MLIWIIEHNINNFSNFNILLDPLVRSIISLLSALIISLLIGPYFIFYLQKLKICQMIRIDGPKTHFNKKKTPTMGGWIILLSIIIPTILYSKLSNTYIWCVLIILLCYSIIGFIDDNCKIKNNNSKGLKAIHKYFWQSIIAIAIIIYLYNTGKNTPMTNLFIPLFKKNIHHLNLFFYILLSYFVIVGTSNAVNLTDGLDGLAIVPIMLISGCFLLIAIITGNFDYSQYINILYIKDASELAIICAAIIGSGLGFLWFNTYPAQLFMGDIGSLSLGGVIGIIAVLLRQELLLLIIGGIFVIETISVILQVISFKIFKKKIFLMAPIHHHYELKGLDEPKIVVRSWIISLILILIGLIILKI